MPNGDSLEEEVVCESSQANVVPVADVDTSSEKSLAISDSEADLESVGKPVGESKSTGSDGDDSLPPIEYTNFIAVSLCLVFCNEGVSITLAMPFIGVMVAELSADLDENSAGYMSGAIIAMFFIAQVVAAPLWGWMGDELGRKPLIMLGLLCSSILSIAFGFTFSIYMAMVVRFFQGMMNANVVAAKTVTVEATNKKTEAKGFAVLSGSWAISSAVGPALGGLLYDPCSWGADRVLPGIFCQFPALLPCLVSSAFGLTTLVTVHKWLPETNSKVRSNPLPYRNVPGAILRLLGGVVRARVGSLCSALSALWGCMSRRGATAVPSDDAEAEGEELRVVGADGEGADKEEAGPPAMTPWSCMMHPVIRGLFLNYMCCSAPNIALMEVLPLYGIADVSVGGLGLRPHHIGTFFFVNGIVGIPGVFILKWMIDKMGHIPLWRVCCFGWSACFALFPLASFVRSFSNDVQLLVFMCILTTPRQILSQTAFSLNHMFIGNAAPHGTKGAVMGSSQSVAAISRFFFPIALTPLFAWSIAKPRPFPINSALCFLICAAVLVYPVVSSFWLDAKQITKPDEAEKEPATEEAATETNDTTEESDEEREGLL